MTSYKARNFLLTLILLTLSLNAAAQNTLSGRVIDAKTNEPIIGATLYNENNQKGLVTDIEGKFTVTGIDRWPVRLSIRYIGYTSTVQTIDQTQESVVLLLEEDNKFLDEVVVVGYGTQRRRELTGAVSSVSKEVLERPANSLQELVGGSIAGLHVAQHSGQPGAGSTLRIRGGNSIYASNDPLYVIDGFLYYSEKNATKAGVGGIDGSLNPLASINPSDIESIEVLKDVSAKAIYGSRGANGVILVTTKKGKRGGNRVHYQYSFGVEQNAKELDLMTAEQWLDVQKTYFNDKPSQYYTQEELSQFKRGTDWQSAVLQQGHTHKHELSISGGDEQNRYLISGNYSKQRGVILNSGLEQFSSRINLDRQLFEQLNIGVTANASTSTQNALTTFEASNYNDSPFSNGIANALTYALYMPPVIPIYGEDGNFNYYNPFEYSYLSYYGQAANPVSDLKNSIGQTQNSSVLGNFFARLQVNDGIAFRFSAGAHTDYITQHFFAPPFTALGINQDIRGAGAIGNRRNLITQTESLFTYTKNLAQHHFVDLLFGYTHQQTTSQFSVSRANRLASFDNLAAGNELPSVSRSQAAYFQSFLGRINYTFQRQYNLTATYRADQSSRFAKGHEWGFFPSIGLSWNADFKPFSSFKIRGTAGQAGNQEIDFDEYEQYFQVGRYDGAPALDMTHIGNPDLTWETTTEWNAGLDAGILEDRIRANIDAYIKNTNDLLVKIPAPLGSGSNQKQIVNLGQVQNKGIEFSLAATVIDQPDFNWSITSNIAHNKNAIIDLGEYNDLTQGNDQQQILRAGHPVGSFYGYRFTGVNSVGEATFADLSGPNGQPDGIVRPEHDRTILGNIQPNFTYGLSSALVLGKFDLLVVFQGAQGGSVYNALRRYLERPNDSYNMSAALLNSWTEENPNSQIPHLNSPRNAELDSRYIEDASYFKWRNLTVGYTETHNLGNNPLTVRLFASARNILSIHSYQGYDPEVASGTDLGVYPASKSLLAGISISF